MLWSSTIEYLRSPDLVVKIQEFFGIQYNHHQLETRYKQYDERETKQNGYHLVHSSNTKIPKQQANIGQASGTNTILKDCDSKEYLKSDNIPYVITNWFWYYLFRFGTELGDEIFYATAIPFWFWNIDGAVGRRVVCVWAIVMYIGQGLKDIIRWPRPGPPVCQLQNKWNLEYGMPSTHAMIGVCMPFSAVIFMIGRYQFSVIVGLIISTIWCTIICISRLYLGMHSVLDVLVGFVLSVLLLIPIVPLVDHLDYLILNSRHAPIFILIVTIAMIVYYPVCDKWTPTRGDTTMTTSVAAGIQIGAWINSQFGYMNNGGGGAADMIADVIQPPYIIIWPTYGMIGLMILRTILGLCGVLISRALAKSMCYACVCTLLGKNKTELKNSVNSLENSDKIIAELCYKYFSCCLVGIVIQYLFPNVFKWLAIGRPDFYTEI